MSWKERLLEVSEQEWRPVSAPALAASSVLVAVVCYFANSGEHWVYVLDSANLAFHEAGHPLFGLLLGNRVMVYGGTMGQLVFPIVATASFWWRRETLSFALCLAWLFENFWNISRYMADAREQVLPLVGGGEHDWTEIFSRWNVLQRDTSIASFVSLVAWAGIIATWAWLVRRWMRDRELE
ncbi:MAG TPA: hypothetical protein VHB46_03605 [Burkholderiales bacterium]|nr:hypothetical protein [Burkholderiales bacterium]